MRLATTLFSALLLCSTLTLALAQERTSHVPDESNYTDWLAFIRPSSEELSFEQIGWRNQFWPAVQEARKLGRPILLWTMNGHPLGCT
jgi:hypothetical protein